MTTPNPERSDEQEVKVGTIQQTCSAKECLSLYWQRTQTDNGLVSTPRSNMTPCVVTARNASKPIAIDLRPASVWERQSERWRLLASDSIPERIAYDPSTLPLADGERSYTMKEYRLFISEVSEEGERITATNILREIHDSMCMCGVWDDCDTEDINRTLIEASQALLATGEWRQDFEDGWIKIESITPSLGSGVTQ